MLVRTLSIFGVTIFGLFSAAESNLPITTCKRDVVDYSACLKRALEEAWPRFLKGLPEYDFPSLDPLFYKYGKYILTSGEVRGKLVLLNVTCIGLSHVHFSDIRTHYNDDVFRLELDAQIPYLRLEGTYRINGSLSVFKLVTQGYFNITAHDVRTTCELTGHLVNDTWIVEHFRAAPSVGKMKIYFDNLIENSKELNDVVLDFINEYWPAIYRTMLPFLVNTFDPWLTEFPNAIFSKVPFSEVFP